MSKLVNFYIIDTFLYEDVLNTPNAPKTPLRPSPHVRVPSTELPQTVPVSQKTLLLRNEMSAAATSKTRWLPKLQEQNEQCGVRTEEIEFQKVW